MTQQHWDERTWISQGGERRRCDEGRCDCDLCVWRPFYELRWGCNKVPARWRQARVAVVVVNNGLGVVY
ncbi:hypothetical protein TIFTF001_020015 [Ficus carica]|uniref:Uncharacterized protein n=1 Tax=Ficus carica TaxID=3494 RepID=A0AA88DJI6_FICCA|nr:hypothetical protein TIFTF001_020015 [Ficus carica]